MPYSYAGTNPHLLCTLQMVGCAHARLRQALRGLLLGLQSASLLPRALHAPQDPNSLLQEPGACHAVEPLKVTEQVSLRAPSRGLCLGELSCSVLQLADQLAVQHGLQLQLGLQLAGVCLRPVATRPGYRELPDMARDQPEVHFSSSGAQRKNSPAAEPHFLVSNLQRPTGGQQMRSNCTAHEHTSAADVVCAS